MLTRAQPLADRLRRCPPGRDRQSASCIPGSPWSMKRSGSPSCSTGIAIARSLQRFEHRAARAARDHVLLDRHEQIVAAPRARSTSASSSGLTKRMLATVASSASAAFERRLQHRRRTRVSRSSSTAARTPCRLRRISPLPSGSAVHLPADRDARPAAARIAHRGRAYSSGTPCRASAGTRSRRTASSPSCWAGSAGT